MILYAPEVWPKFKLSICSLKFHDASVHLILFYLIWSYIFILFYFIFVFLEARDIKVEQNYIFSFVFNRDEQKHHNQRKLQYGDPGKTLTKFKIFASEPWLTKYIINSTYLLNNCHQNWWTLWIKKKRRKKEEGIITSVSFHSFTQILCLEMGEEKRKEGISFLPFGCTR